MNVVLFLAIQNALCTRYYEVKSSLAQLHSGNKYNLRKGEIKYLFL